MFSLCFFIVQRLIWKEIGFIIEFSRDEKLQKYRIIVSAYQLFTQRIGPYFDMFTATIFIFSSMRFLNMCKPRTGLSTSIGILWKWASKPAELAGNGECRLTQFHPIRNILANEIYLFSRLSHQTDCLFTWASRSM